MSILFRHVAPLVVVDQAASSLLSTTMMLTRGTEFFVWLVLVKLFDVDIVFFGARRQPPSAAPTTAEPPWNVRLLDVARGVGEWMLLRFVWFPMNSFFAVLLLDRLGESPCMSCRVRPELFLPLPVFVQALRRAYEYLLGWRRGDEVDETGLLGVQEMSTRSRRSRFKKLNFSDEFEDLMKRKMMFRRCNRLMKPHVIEEDVFY